MHEAAAAGYAECVRLLSTPTLPLTLTLTLTRPNPNLNPTPNPTLIPVLTLPLTRCVRLLLGAGADAGAVDNEGKTPG